MADSSADDTARQLIIKLIRLAESTDFAAEREAALAKADQVGCRSGIHWIFYDRRWYHLRPSCATPDVTA
jgi:hypothetical protein